MASKKGSAVAKIGLDYFNFKSGAKAVAALATMMSRTLSSTMGNVAAMAIGKLTSSLTNLAKAVVRNVKDIYNQGEALANMAKRTGIATREYMKYSLALEKGVTMDDAGKLLGENANIMAENAELFRNISLKLFAVGERVRGFFMGIAESAGPFLNNLLDRLVNLDFSSYGKRIADPIVKASQTILYLFESNELWDTVKKGLSFAIKYAADLFMWLANFAEKAITAAMGGALANTLADLTIGLVKSFDSFFVYFENNLLKSAQVFVKPIIEVMDMIVDVFNLASKISIKLGIDKEGAMERLNQRSLNRESRRERFSVKSLPEVENIVERTNHDGLGNALKEVMKTMPSIMSMPTESAFSDLKDVIINAINKGQAETNKGGEAFENRTPMSLGAIGVDSLTAVGGGGGLGNVSATLGEKQLETQKQILEALKAANERGPYRGENFYRTEPEQHKIDQSSPSAYGFNHDSNTLSVSLF